MEHTFTRSAEAPVAPSPRRRPSPVARRATGPTSRSATEMLGRPPVAPEPRQRSSAVAVRMSVVLAVVLEAARDGGWRVKKVRRAARSWYVSLRHLRRGKMCVRISDHKSRAFRNDGRKAWSVCVNRDRYLTLLLYLVNKLTKGAR